METSVQTCYRHPDQVAGVICQRCDKPICPRCMHQASVGFHCPDCTKAGKQKVYQGVAALQTPPILTQVLIAVNAVVFVIGVAIQKDGDAILDGAVEMNFDYGLFAKVFQNAGGFRFQYPGGVGEGEWYRLVTSGFLHHGIIHLLFNMFALWMLGRAVEHILGRLRFGIVFGVALLGGSLGALLLDPESFTAGASGAIYGLFGAVFIAQRAQGIPFRDSPLLGVLVLNLFITLSVPNISIGGHVGGLAAGALATWVLVELPRRQQLDKRIPLAICGALALTLVVASVAFATSYSG